jgi:cytochrome c-type biogenesis protein
VAADASGPGLLAAFGGGLISFLSPCVLPLVPGYLSLMSGVRRPESASPQDRVRLLRATLLFVLGFTIVFVALGAGASAVGNALREHQRTLETVAGALIVAMGLFLAGLWTPMALMAERRLEVLPSRLGPWAAPVMGMAFAFGWTPCIGPILSGVLALAEHQGTVGRGVVLLTAYSLGLGVPFVASAIALDRIAGAMSFFKRHARAINAVAGLVLAGFGVLLLTHHVGWLSSRVIDLMEKLHLGKLTQI